MEPDLWFLYKQMLRSRIFEERISELWKKGRISGEMHLGLGEEAIAAGIVAHLEEGDAMALDHRTTPPLVMRGVNLVLLLKEFLGHSDGLCGGTGGHMHLFSPETLSASSGIVGAAGPMGAGFALAAQYLRPRKIAVAFFGEGAMNQGMLLESINLASIWKLPVLFVCKDNEWAISTHSPSVSAGNLLDRGKVFNLEGLEVNGADVEEVWKAGLMATEKIRNGQGPAFIQAHCSHLEGHFLGDPFLCLKRHPLSQMRKRLGPLIRALISKKGNKRSQRLRNAARIASLVRDTISSQKKKKGDPLICLIKKLAKDRNRLQEIKTEVRQEIEGAVEMALKESRKEV